MKFATDPTDGTIRDTEGEHTVEVLYDEGDLGHIWVINRRTNPPSYLKLASEYPDYHTGLTLWQDKAIRAELKEAGSPITEETLMAKKQELLARYEPRNLSRKRVNRAAAKFQEPTRPLHGLPPGSSPAAAIAEVQAAEARENKRQNGQVIQAPAAPIAEPVPAWVRHDLYDLKGREVSATSGQEPDDESEN
jgi:hypothetical protein